VHKIIALTLIFMGSVHGMDRGPGPQKQGQQQSGLEALRQDKSTQIPRIDGDLLPIIEGYHGAQHQLHHVLQPKLDQARYLKDILNLGRTDEKYKRAPISLKLKKYGAEVNDEKIKEITEVFPNLASLDLSDLLYVTDKGLEHLKILANLTNLNLGMLRITDVGLGHIKDLVTMTDLNLTTTEITDAGLRYLNGLINLKSLSLAITGTTNRGLAHLTNLINLETLNLSLTGITDEGLKLLLNFPKLTTLNLGGMRQITGVGLGHLKSLHNLRTLILVDVRRITPAGIRDLQEALPNCNIITKGYQ
jgi:hypothetical protein